MRAKKIAIEEMPVEWRRRSAAYRTAPHSRRTSGASGDSRPRRRWRAGTCRVARAVGDPLVSVVPLRRIAGGERAPCCAFSNTMRRGSLTRRCERSRLRGHLVRRPDAHCVAALVGEASAATIESLSTYAVERRVSSDDSKVSTPIRPPAGLAPCSSSSTPSGLAPSWRPAPNAARRSWRVSARPTGLAMAANCLSASWLDAGALRLSRQRWGGSLIEDAVLDGAPALLTVASDGVLAAPAETPTSTTLHDVRRRGERPRSPGGRSRVDCPGRGSLARDARVVVGGGRGVGSEEGFAAIDELASLLGAAVGVSRVVTSAGWRPHAQQVGQTGTKISPELYLACGISGATQHLAGCRSAKHVVAINTDADAPFLARADFALVGDLSVIVPAISEAIRSRTSS